MAANQEIILYHYATSPFAKRIVWYLTLRGIPYTQCLQPMVMPRPDLAAIGTDYRRIPVLSIGRDIYNDSRLMFSKLEKFYPPSFSHPALSAASSTPEHKALEKLLAIWVIEGQFGRASQLLPAEMMTEKFQKDRQQFVGVRFDKKSLAAGRPEALVEVRGHFEMLESTIFADGRDWVLGTEAPTWTDIEAIWVFHWLKNMPGGLPPSLISATQFPSVFAWFGRFDNAVAAATTKLGRPRTIEGSEALKIVSDAEFAEEEGEVDSNDPVGLRKGQQIEVWPLDSGFSNKDRGTLVKLDGNEIVIEKETKSGKKVRVHAPRHGFRLRALRQPNL